MPDDDFIPTRFIRKQELLGLIGVADFTIWRWIKEGTFPPPYRLNPEGSPNGAVAWKESEIKAWMDSRPAGHGPGITQAHEARRRNVRARTPKRKYQFTRRTPT